eukprot:2616060-Pyramimonas_sp.AAC.1
MHGAAGGGRPVGLSGGADGGDDARARGPHERAPQGGAQSPSGHGRPPRPPVTASRARLVRRENIPAMPARTVVYRRPRAASPTAGRSFLRSTERSVKRIPTAGSQPGRRIVASTAGLQPRLLDCSRPRWIASPSVGPRS